MKAKLYYVRITVNRGKWSQEPKGTITVTTLVQHKLSRLYKNLQIFVTKFFLVDKSFQSDWKSFRRPMESRIVIGWSDSLQNGNGFGRQGILACAGADNFVESGQQVIKTEMREKGRRNCWISNILLTKVEW